MPSINHATGRPYWSPGRGFTSQDPERQGEVLGYARATAIESTAPARPAAPAKPVQRGWLHVQPDMESSSFEGSSSGRWR